MKLLGSRVSRIHCYGIDQPFRPAVVDVDGRKVRFATKTGRSFST
jgi:hypothetical protein